MKRVSEEVTIDKVKQWKPGNIITIEAGTGSGKSYFIKNNLYALAKKDNKKILFLIHRTNCFNQFHQELIRDDKTDVIHIRTYQSLEQSYIKQKSFNFSEYQYIVCDEFHYHIQDSLFNKFTDISLEMILAQTDKIRIMMSATGHNVQKYINKYKKYEIIPYVIPINYDYITSLVFFNKDESFDKLIEQAVKEKKKTIFFIQSAEKAFNLYNKYKEISLFNCSKHNTKYYKHVEEEKINSMLINERFEELILITTTCMDAGVNIIDNELTQVVVDVKDIGTLIQCLGRKRLQDKKDTISLYVKTINNKQLGGMSSQIKRRQERAKYLRETSPHEYMVKYPRDYDKWNIVYNDFVEGDKGLSSLKVNELVYFKCIVDSIQIDLMLNEEFGYCKYIARMFGFHDPELKYFYTILEEDYMQKSLEEYLESVVGKKLFKEEQKELKQTFKDSGLNAKTLGINTLNGNLKDMNMPFVIEQGKRKSHRDSEGKIKKEASHWLIGKITY